MKREQLAINSVSTRHKDLIEMFSRELWQLPAAEAARRCYESLLPLCR